MEEPQLPGHRPEEFVAEHEATRHPSSLRTPSGETFEPTSNSNGRFYSPLLLNIAASEGVSMSELENIPRTGNEGRVTKKDILQYVSERRSGKVRSQQSTVQSYQPSVSRQQENVVRETPSTT